MAKCGFCETGRTWHSECAEQTLRSYVGDTTYAVGTGTILVTRLAPKCYLCGVNRSEQREHIHPRAKGGSEDWANVAAACRQCNMVKGDRVEPLSAQQTARLNKQQLAFLNAFARCTPEVVVDALVWLAASDEEQGSGPFDEAYDMEIDGVANALDYAAERTVLLASSTEELTDWMTKIAQRMRELRYFKRLDDGDWEFWTKAAVESVHSSQALKGEWDLKPPEQKKRSWLRWRPR